ncbi:MAG: alanine--tRNA ligase, partial [Oscillospiraceae bacterium]|nr:alanine--tRNA ligase [Oscillospiraceae bacterium]
GVCEVIDTQKVVAGKFAHKVKVTEGAVSCGQQAQFIVDKANRESTMRNHSCAHLLQSALRKVLGDHVHQAGQLVDAERLRFDFSHFEGVTPQQLSEIEAIVNGYILAAYDIKVEEMAIDDAKKLGAMALFSEKYGETVRVVTMGDASVEFCGGTHLDNTSKAGLFKIVSESSVASGVRRIEAVTGAGVLALIKEQADLISACASTLKIGNTAELANRCAGVMAEIKGLEKERDSLQSEISNMKLKSLLDKVTEVNGVNVITAKLDGVKPDMLRKMCDEIKADKADTIAVLAGIDGGKANLACAAGKDAVAKGAHAGKIVGKIAAITGGKGGGRPDSAMAGVADISKLDEALSQATEVVKEFVK